MKLIFNHYNADEPIPVREHLKNKKLSKYFNRETGAAIVTANQLLKNLILDKNTPIYYAMCIVEYEDYGLNKISKASLDNNDLFSVKNFTTQGMGTVSPLAQFKILYNMPLSFIVIENNLHGDNAALYSSAKSLLQQGLYTDWKKKIILGAGKIYKDGSVSCGFALLNKIELSENSHIHLDNKTEAIELFQKWHNENNNA